MVLCLLLSSIKNPDIEDKPVTMLGAPSEPYSLRSVKPFNIQAYICVCAYV